VGLTADGFVAVRDASAVPLSERQAVNALVTAENQDRRALYSEIARANGHPNGLMIFAIPLRNAGYTVRKPVGGYRAPKAG